MRLQVENFCQLDPIDCENLRNAFECNSIGVQNGSCLSHLRSQILPQRIFDGSLGWNCAFWRLNLIFESRAADSKSRIGRDRKVKSVGGSWNSLPKGEKYGNRTVYKGHADRSFERRTQIGIEQRADPGWDQTILGSVLENETGNCRRRVGEGKAYNNAWPQKLTIKRIKFGFGARPKRRKFS